MAENGIITFLKRLTSPNAPSVGKLNLYAKDDDILYAKNSAGVESPLAMGGVWKDWTPTQDNLSGGTLDYARYCVIGKTFSFFYKYTLGGSLSSSTPVIYLPFIFNSRYTNANIGQARYQDTGNATYAGQVLGHSSLEGFYFGAFRSDSTYTNFNNIRDTIPFTWGSGDVIRAYGMIEME